MGETTCLMQQPFSYTACEATKGNPIHALSQSVSFGRFVSDSLSWEKWSSFSHNKYVEEAEKFSRPGSVAEKKAFFEAHYRTLAARKAAALLEQQANDAAENGQEPQHEGPSDFSSQNGLQIMSTNLSIDVDKQVVYKEMDTRASSFTGINDYNSLVENSEFEALKLEQVDTLNKNQIFAEGHENTEPLGPEMELQISEAKEMEKPLLKDFASGKDESASTSKMKPSVSSSKHRRSSKLQSSPAKPKLAVCSKREKNATPVRKKYSTDSMDRKKLSPKSSCKAMNFTPVREFNRITSKILSNFNSPRVASSSKGLKDCATPLTTTNVVQVHKETKHQLVTPHSENRRPMNPSSSESKPVRPRWHFLPTDCSKFKSSSKTKLKSPNVSTTPFSLRTEERAARRKKKLEEKFNANQPHQELPQATLKEKAESEVRKLRQALCFKARPLPKFYKERVCSNPEKFLLTARSQTPKTDRKPAVSNAHCGYQYQPSSKTYMGKNGFKKIKGKNNEEHSDACENNCPNVQRAK